MKTAPEWFLGLKEGKERVLGLSGKGSSRPTFELKMHVKRCRSFSIL